MMTDFETLVYTERVSKTPTAQLLIEYGSYAAVKKLHLFSAERKIIAAEILRRCGEELTEEENDDEAD